MKYRWTNRQWMAYFRLILNHLNDEAHDKLEWHNYKLYGYDTSYLIASKDGSIIHEEMIW